MDMKALQSTLKMENFYFMEASIIRQAKISEGKMQINVRKAIVQTADHEYSVTVLLTINRDDDLHIVVKANADFSIKEEDMQREERIIQNNTVAIMFPFIRSQVSLLTTQPGMMPIVLPAINTAKLVEEKE